MTYLDNNLITLNCNLLRANFDRILSAIWVEVLEEFDEVLSRSDEVGKTYARLSINKSNKITYLMEGQFSFSLCVDECCIHESCNAADANSWKHSFFY